MENFFGKMKNEMFYGHEYEFKSLDELKEAMEEYIAYYNTERIQKEYIAGRFAAKEAIFKMTQDKNYLHYSILHQKTGQPYVKDHLEIEISISHDAGIAIAIAVSH